MSFFKPLREKGRKQKKVFGKGFLSSSQADSSKENAIQPESPQPTGSLFSGLAIHTKTTDTTESANSANQSCPHSTDLQGISLGQALTKEGAGTETAGSDPSHRPSRFGFIKQSGTDKEKVEKEDLVVKPDSAEKVNLNVKVYSSEEAHLTEKENLIEKIVSTDEKDASAEQYLVENACQSGVSKFNSIAQSASSDSSCVQMASSPQEAITAKVKKTKKIRRFGQRPVDDSTSRTSNTRERKGSITSENSDTSSVLSEGSDMTVGSLTLSTSSNHQAVDSSSILDSTPVVTATDADTLPLTVSYSKEAVAKVYSTTGDGNLPCIDPRDKSSDVVIDTLDTVELSINKDCDKLSAKSSLLDTTLERNDYLSTQTVTRESDLPRAADDLPSTIDGNRSRLSENRPIFDERSIIGKVSLEENLDIDYKVGDELCTEHTEELSTCFSAEGDISVGNVENTESKVEYEDLNKTSSVPNSIYKIELSDTEKVELCMEALNARLKDMEDEKESFVQTRDTVIEKLRATLLSRSTLEEKIDSLRLQQQKAVEEDDFDKAEEINTRLEEMLNETSSITHCHPLFDSKVTDLFGSFDVLMARQNQDYTRIIEEYAEISEEQENCLRHITTSTKQKTTKKRGEIMAEKSELERSLNHLSLDENFVHKTIESIESQIKERTSSLEEGKNELIKEKDSVEGKIDQLEESLKLLYNKRDDLTDQIQSINNNIKDVVGEYAPQLLNLAKENEDIKLKELAVQESIKQLKEKESQLEESDAAEQSCIERLQTAKEDISERLDNIRELQKSAVKEVTDVSKILDINRLKVPQDDALEVILADEETLARSVKSLTSMLIQTQGKASGLRKEIATSEAEIEKLKHAKQLAVSERKFQDAKVISTALNSLTQEKKDMQNTIDSLGATISLTMDELERLKPKHEEMKQKLCQFEKSRDQRYLQALSQAVSELRKFILADNEELWIIPILSLEIEICQRIGLELVRKHDLELPDELMEGNQISASNKKAEENHTNENELQQRSCTESKELQQFCKEIDKLEERLNIAVAEEDYDLAEELNIRIIEIQEKLKDSSNCLNLVSSEEQYVG